MGVELDQVVETVLGLEDAGVVGEQTKQQAHQEHFQLFSRVVVPLQGVMKLADCDNRLLVDRIGFTDVLRAVASNKGKEVDVLRKFRQFELVNRLGTLVGLKIMQLEVLEVTNQNLAGQFLGFEAGEVVNGLLVGLGQVAPERLVLNEQRAFP